MYTRYMYFLRARSRYLSCNKCIYETATVICSIRYFFGRWLALFLKIIYRQRYLTISIYVLNFLYCWICRCYLVIHNYLKFLCSSSPNTIAVLFPKLLPFCCLTDTNEGRLILSCNTPKICKYTRKHFAFHWTAVTNTHLCKFAKD